jgi:hypothetical protein
MATQASCTWATVEANRWTWTGWKSGWTAPAAVVRIRMATFEKLHATGPGIVISTKIRVSAGCFHREHSPRAYALIDEYFSSIKESHSVAAFEEHESGPEVLVYLALSTAGATLAKSVLDLVTAIIKARADGIKKGDEPSAPVELVVRRVWRDGECQEKRLPRFGPADRVDRSEIEDRLLAAVREFMSSEGGDATKQ